MHRTLGKLSLQEVHLSGDQSLPRRPPLVGLLGQELGVPLPQVHHLVPQLRYICPWLLLVHLQPKSAHGGICVA